MFVFLYLLYLADRLMMIYKFYSRLIMFYHNKQRREFWSSQFYFSRFFSVYCSLIPFFDCYTSEVWFDASTEALAYCLIIKLKIIYRWCSLPWSYFLTLDALHRNPYAFVNQCVFRKESYFLRNVYQMYEIIQYFGFSIHHLASLLHHFFAYVLCKLISE